MVLDGCSHDQSKELRFYNTWTQIAAGEDIFSLENFIASATDPEKRRFLIPGQYTTALENLEDVAKGDPVSSDNLPLYAGRPILLAWWKSTHDALQAGDLQRVRRLVIALR